MAWQFHGLRIVRTTSGSDRVARSAFLAANDENAAAFRGIWQIDETSDFGAVGQIEFNTIRIRWIRRTNRFPIVREEADGDRLFHGLNSRRS